MTATTKAQSIEGVCDFCQKPAGDFCICDSCEAKYREIRNSEINDLRIEINQAISNYQQ